MVAAETGRATGCVGRGQVSYKRKNSVSYCSITGQSLAHRLAKNPRSVARQH